MKRITIGRAGDNDWVIEGDGVEDHHAQILIDDGSYRIEALAGARLSIRGVEAESADLDEGDEVQLGAHLLRIDRELLEQELAEPAKPAKARVAKTIAEPIAISKAGPKAKKVAKTIAEPIAIPEALKKSKVAKTAPMEPLPEMEEAVVAEMEALEASQKTLNIGYAAGNDLVINAPQVSSFHARIFVEGGKTYITDLRSTNGTFLNGVKLTKPMPISVGDLVGLGSYSLSYGESLHKRLVKAPSRTLAIDTNAIDWQSATGARLRLGRAEDNEIVIPAPQVSGYHAELRPKGEGWLLRDLDSLNGTFINVRSVAIEAGEDHFVSKSDVLFLGSYRFPMSRVSQQQASDSPAERLALPEGVELLRIGRGPDNDIVLNNAQVSRYHAKLMREGEQWIVEDLGSANGTYVDGERVSRAKINQASRIAFGTHVLSLDLAKGELRQDYPGELMLRAHDISVEVKDSHSPGGRKKILKEVSFTALPTEFIGILGPSGSGKTTLLMALNGYLRPSSGQSLLNNLDLYRNYRQFRGSIGYVPQDDIIHNELTVYESLYYTAKLRLPPDTSKAEIDARIDDILDKLGILETKHVLIGSPLKKGISGGQRKRVNLAQELLTEPSLLFLDEPTSGLASSDTRGVMRLLRRLADEGRTILLTIHQPSLDAYRELDNVIYLVAGELVYYGPTYPDSLSFFQPDIEADSPEALKALASPDSAMETIAESMQEEGVKASIEAWRARYRSSEYHQDYVVGRREGQSAVEQEKSARRDKAVKRMGWRQWATLTRRMLAIKLKDRLNLAILLLQAPIIGLLISAVFTIRSEHGDDPLSQFLGIQSQDGIRAAALFMLVASSVWFGTSNAAREIVSEQAIYRRERMLNLKIPSYVLSKFAVLALLALVQCTILLATTYPFIGFAGNPLRLLVVLVANAGAGIGIGLLLSTIVRSAEASVALVPLILIPQLVLGGLIVPLELLEGGGGAVRASSNLMVSRWAFEGLLQEEQAGLDSYQGIEVSEEERALAESFELTPADPKKYRVRSFGGVRFENKERVAQLEALFKVRLADRLAAAQRESTLVERYFGGFAKGYYFSVGVLALFSFVLLYVVAVLLWYRDRRLLSS